MMSFLAKSSVPGMNRLVSSGSRLKVLLWLIVFLFCWMGFAYQTFQFLSIYNKLPSVVQMEVVNEGYAEFPAVTLCNLNRLRKSELCKHFPEKCKEKLNMTLSNEDIVDVMYSLLASGEHYKKYKLGHSQSMIQGCIFKGTPTIHEHECLELLEYSFDPDYGNCFTLSNRNKEGKVLEARESDFWREENDLSFLVDLEAEELTEPRRHEGLLVTIHDDSLSPDIHSDGVIISSGLSYALSIQKSTVHMLAAPYKSNCTDYNKLPWGHNCKRRCTSRLCTVGCSQYFQEQKCGSATVILSVFYKKLPFDPQKVTEETKNCAEKEEKRTQEYCRNICSLPCRETTFAVKVGTTELAETDVMEYTLTAWRNRSWTNQRKNLATLKIFYSTLEHKIFRLVPKYESLELFSYLGSYSGVWLGFSLLTLYEIVEIVLWSLLKSQWRILAKITKKKINHKRCK